MYPQLRFGAKLFDRPSVEDAATRKRLSKLAWLLDNSIPVPGLNARIGLDGLLSLIPVVGDTAGTLLSSYILAEGVRLGIPKTLLLRMAFNLVIDTLLGMIPLIGDLFDFAWKANQRNVRLLDAYLANPRRVRSSNRALLWGLAALVIAGLVLIVIVAVWLVQALWGVLFQ